MDIETIWSLVNSVQYSKENKWINQLKRFATWDAWNCCCHGGSEKGDSFVVYFFFRLTIRNRTHFDLINDKRKESRREKRIKVKNANVCKISKSITQSTTQSLWNIPLTFLPGIVWAFKIQTGEHFQNNQFLLYIYFFSHSPTKLTWTRKRMKEVYTAHFYVNCASKCVYFVKYLWHTHMHTVISMFNSICRRN